MSKKNPQKRKLLGGIQNDPPPPPPPDGIVRRVKINYFSSMQDLQEDWESFSIKKTFEDVTQSSLEQAKIVEDMFKNSLYHSIEIQIDTLGLNDFKKYLHEVNVSGWIDKENQSMLAEIMTKHSWMKKI